jgi:hypothetical protein
MAIYIPYLGVQCYDSKFLSIYPKMAPTPLQLEEDLEQLKVLENGHRMKVSQCAIRHPLSSRFTKSYGTCDAASFSCMVEIYLEHLPRQFLTERH